MTQASTATVPPRQALSWKLLPAVMLSGSAVLLFGFEFDLAGYAVLRGEPDHRAAGRPGFARHAALIAVGLVIISAVLLNADLSIRHMLLMGGALALAVVVPYAVSRFGYRDHLVRFPVLTGRRWPTVAKLYLIGVVALGLSHLAVLPDQHRGVPELAGCLGSERVRAAVHRGQLGRASGMSCSSSAPPSRCCVTIFRIGSPTSCRR